MNLPKTHHNYILVAVKQGDNYAPPFSNSPLQYSNFSNIFPFSHECFTEGLVTLPYLRAECKLWNLLEPTYQQNYGIFKSLMPLNSLLLYSCTKILNTGETESDTNTNSQIHKSLPLLTPPLCTVGRFVKIELFVFWTQHISSKMLFVFKTKK